VHASSDALFTPRPLGQLLDIAQVTGGELEALTGRGGHPYQVVAALTRELRSRAPAILVLEDVHWADEATFDVLRLLGRRVESVPALVVASIATTSWIALIQSVRARPPLRPGAWSA
jgi:hypothetical protein